jgi:hypothetical protein
MVRNGDAADLSMPRWMEVWDSLDSPSTISKPVVVHASLGPSGKVSREVCATSDPSLNDRALERAKWVFGPSDSHLEYYLQVLFVPARASPIPAVSEARIPLVTFYLEQDVTTHQEPNYHRSEVLARRSDGATVHIGIDPARGKDVRTLEFPEGSSFDVYDSIGIKVTYPRRHISPAAQKAKALEGPKDCAGANHAPLLRRDQLAGEDVEVTQQISGDSRATIWYAARLGCAVLQADYEKLQPDGTYQLVTQTKTTKLVVGEPDSHLFEIASDLEETKPSEAEFRLWESRNPSATAEKKAEKRREFERLRSEDDRFYASGK